MLTHFHDDLGKLRKSPLGTKDFRAWSWFPSSSPRDPPLLPHTSIALLNGSTQWRARATYSCLPGYQPSKGEIYEQPSFVKLFAVEKEQLRVGRGAVQNVKSHLQFILSNIEFEVQAKMFVQKVGSEEPRRLQVKRGMAWLWEPPSPNSYSALDELSITTFFVLSFISFFFFRIPPSMNYQSKLLFVFYF